MGDPKAWVLALTMTGMFHVSNIVAVNTALLVLIATLINIPSLLTWTLFGKYINKMIKNAKQRKNSILRSDSF